jgi:hypothetical protein
MILMRVKKGCSFIEATFLLLGRQRSAKSYSSAVIFSTWIILIPCAFSFSLLLNDNASRCPTVTSALCLYHILISSWLHEP